MAGNRFNLLGDGGFSRNILNTERFSRSSLPRFISIWL